MSITIDWFLKFSQFRVIAMNVNLWNVVIPKKEDLLEAKDLF